MDLDIGGVGDGAEKIVREIESAVKKYGPTPAFIQGVVMGSTWDIAQAGGYPSSNTFTENEERRINDAVMRISGFNLNLGGVGSAANKTPFKFGNLLNEAWLTVFGLWLYGQTKLPLSSIAEKVIVPGAVGYSLSQVWAAGPDGPAPASQNQAAGATPGAQPSVQDIGALASRLNLNRR